MLLPVLYPFCNSYYQYWQYTYIVGLWCRLDLGFINKKDTISKTSYLYDKYAYLRLISKLNMVYNHNSQKDKIGYGNIRFSIAQLINSFYRIMIIVLMKNMIWHSFPIVLLWFNNWVYIYNTYLYFSESNCLSKLSKLTHLDLSQNYFDKEILRSLGALPVLKYLDLTDNSMEGPLSSKGTCIFEFSLSRIPWKSLDKIEIL